MLVFTVFHYMFRPNGHLHVGRIFYFHMLEGRSQWPRGQRHELSSPAPTLRSWVRIPIRHGCLCVFCVRFFCFCIVSSETASRPNKRLMRTYHWISLFMSYIKSAN
jgi:hypothetical protein